MKILPILTMLCSLLSLASCTHKLEFIEDEVINPQAEVLVEDPSVKYLFLDGPAKLNGEQAAWIEVTGGPAILNWTTSVYGVSSQGIDACNSDLGDLYICGNGWIKKSLIRGKTHIQGQAHYCDSISFGRVCIDRQANIINSVFHHDVHVCGDVTAKCTQFPQGIYAKAECITLSGVHASRVYFYPCGEWPDRQLLKLKHGSIVGCVEFPSGRGWVVADSTSHHGVILGGKAIKPYPTYETSCNETE